MPNTIIVGMSDQDEVTLKDMAQTVEGVIRLSAGRIDAKITGTSTDEIWGTEFAAWISATVPTTELKDIRERLSQVAWVFGQEAFALTVGQVEFVKAQA